MTAVKRHPEPFIVYSHYGLFNYLRQAAAVQRRAGQTSIVQGRGEPMRGALIYDLET